MPKTIPLRELIRRFRVLGFNGPFSGGRHQFMAKGAQKVRIPNPHQQKDIGISLIDEILRQASITEEEWESTAD
jgi:predicted RNA binding protein YcfA (HicA-like mRNA interferase family)